MVTCAIDRYRAVQWSAKVYLISLFQLRYTLMLQFLSLSFSRAVFCRRIVSRTNCNHRLLIKPSFTNVPYFQVRSEVTNRRHKGSGRAREGKKCVSLATVDESDTLVRAPIVDFY